MATSVNSSTSSSSLSSLSTKTGMAGLVSGLDTDSLVESLTASSRSKISKQEQKIQTLQWKQTAYRGVTKALKEFQTKYLDVLSGTNFRSEKLYNTVKASTASTKISVSTTSAATAGSITIGSITKLATNQTVTAKDGVAISNPLSGKMTSVTPGTMDATDVTNLLSNINGKSIKMTLDGKVKTITFDAAFVASASGSTTNLQNALQTKLNTAFGYKTGTTPMVNASVVNDQLSFTSSASGSQLTVNALNSDTTTLGFLGLTDGRSDKLNTSLTLEKLPLASALVPAADGSYKLSINSVNFTFNKTDTLATVMSRINSGTAGVTMGYSTLSDKFTMTANDSGLGDNIVISEAESNLMSAFGLNGTNAKITAGQNAELTVNGQAIIRTSNSIEVDGVKIELLEESTDPITVSLKSDTTSLKDTIKKFVTDYNTMIDMVNGLVKETADSAYQPLTETQKADMSEKEIESWETKAKKGLLSSDNTLRGITSKMQSLMYGSAVSGGISLYDMGITSAGYSENGKLQIDEGKLETAIQTKGASIQDLFTTETTGLANKLNDIITGAVKTAGTKGTRGTLIELAGYESTMSDGENSITESITKTNKSIAELKEKLEDEEKFYWSKFSALETALSSLNAQSSMLTTFSAG